MFYTVGMEHRAPSVTLSIKFADWFEANATGWAVAVVPLIVFLILASAAALAILR